MGLKIMSINTRRFSRSNKILQIKMHIEEKDPDVVLLQEVAILAMYENVNKEYDACFISS